jgi:hypothetical protein
MELDENQILQLTDKFDLRASGENDRYSVSQISTGYYNMNAVAFYVLKGELLVAFYEFKAVERLASPLRMSSPAGLLPPLTSAGAPSGLHHDRLPKHPQCGRRGHG